MPTVIAALVVLCVPASAGAATPRSAAHPAGAAQRAQVAAGATSLSARRFAGLHPSSAHIAVPHVSVAPCTFNGSGIGETSVTPGQTLSVVCSGFVSNGEVVLGEVSP
ncbi:MAG: hypothetical protein ACRDY1_06140, partial [Acidimicrobiales bacterium]